MLVGEKKIIRDFSGVRLNLTGELLLTRTKQLVQ